MKKVSWTIKFNNKEIDELTKGYEDKIPPYSEHEDFDPYWGAIDYDPDWYIAEKFRLYLKDRGINVEFEDD